MYPSLTKNLNKNKGMVLVLTLILMLTLTMMASAMIITVNTHADLTASVTQKPTAIQVSESCIDQAVKWIQTPDGLAWMALGVGSKIDIAAEGTLLYGKNLMDDTAKLEGDRRSEKFKTRIGKASCTSVVLEVITKESEGASSSGIGSEVGSDPDYDADSLTSAAKYSIKVIAEGIFNTPTLLGGTLIDEDNWNVGSSKAKIEVIFEYQT